MFTDGCAKQYKSRKNAYCIAELAQEFKIIITHNYAPTASFKTMVDGQGDLTKSTYRRLEKSEIEGTRCPTSYDLFKLFTSDYPMTPVEIPDEKKRLMTITNRMHRFLFDKADSTVEMNARAESEGDVIVTDYIGERWDAPTLRGIKSIFCLIGRTVDNQAKLHSRGHTCFCQSCMIGDFEECSEVLTVGVLKEELVSKLPYKDPSPSSIKPTGSMLEKINHLKNVFDNAGDEQVIVAIMKEMNGYYGEAFELAIMRKGVKQLKKDFQYDYLINGVPTKFTLEKNTWCITVRFLRCVDYRCRDYSIPVKAKEVKISLTAVYHPESVTNTESKIRHTSRSEIKDNHQTGVLYTIDETTLETIRTALNPNSNAIDND